MNKKYENCHYHNTNRQKIMNTNKLWKQLELFKKYVLKNH